MVFFFAMRAMHMEIESGSISFLIQFLVATLMIQLVYLVLAIGLGFIYPPFLSTMCWGIWPVYMWVITSDAFKNPNATQPLCCFPIQIKAIWCPFIWLGLFTLMMGIMSLGVWSGFIVGIIHYKGLLKASEPSANFINKLERGCCKCFSGRTEFIT